MRRRRAGRPWWRSGALTAVVVDSRGEEVEEGEEVMYELTTQPIWTEEARRTKIDGGAELQAAQQWRTRSAGPIRPEKRHG